MKERIINPSHKYAGRNIAGVGLGIEFPTIVRPHADDLDHQSLWEGVQKRSAMAPPPGNPAKKKRLREFFHRFARKYFVPMDPHTWDVDSWLKEANYPEWRKIQLKRIWEECMDPTNKKHAKVKGFMKDESYDDFKYPRLINPRTDEFKCLAGPVFHELEKQIYPKHRAFVKGRPRHEWPDYILSLFDHNKPTMVGDFEAWEAHLTKELQELEFIVYDYILGDQAPWYWEFIRRASLGRQHFIYPTMTVKQDTVRCSGDYQTSLGNVIVNVGCAEFLAEEAGGEVVMVAEGDDSLTQWSCSMPTAEDYAEISIRITIGVEKSVATASFCGLIFDINDRIVVVDPIKMMAKFGWTTRNYKQASARKLMMLAKAKAFSFLYQYSGCPIISKMALWVLRHTAQIDLRPLLQSGAVNFYERQQLIAALEHKDELIEIAKRTPSLNTRLLMEELFGVTVPMQDQLEQWFQTADYEPMPEHYVMDLVPTAWLNYGRDYTYLASLDDLDQLTAPG